MEFCHLHLHNEFSVLDGYGTAERYARRASQLGFKYLALTNHGNIDGLIQWQEACEKYEIEPVMGCEMYIVEDALQKEKGDRRYHITLLIKNQRGFRNINRLLTYANLKGFYYRPRIDYKTLLKHLDGLYILTGCIASFLTDIDKGEKYLKKILKRTSNVALEIMPHNIDLQRWHNEECYILHKEYGIPMVATNDCHYIKPKDWQAQDVLLAMQTKSKLKDPDRYKFGIKNLHLRSSEQMEKAFLKYHNLKKADVRYAIRNTVNVAKHCCKFRIKMGKVRLPEVDIPDGWDEDEILYQMCLDALKKMGLRENKKYLERAREEMALISKKGFTRYFLIVNDLLSWCRKEGVMYGPGRGSVGGSLVAYLLDVTSVDPLVHNTIFDRFINKDRIDYPDIDLDFEDNKRDRVRAYLENKYGSKKVVGVTTALRMRAKNAIADVARVHDISHSEVDEVAKAIDSLSFRQGSESFSVVDEALKKNQNVGYKIDAIKRFAKLHPAVMKYARKLDGQVKAYGQHAAALVLSPVDLTRGSKGNLVQRKNNLIINWDMNDAEKIGLLKVDILGLTTLTIVNETNRLVGENHNKIIDFKGIQLDDSNLLDMINEGQTTGLFQIQTPFMTNICKEIGIDEFRHLRDAVALSRPGPHDSGMTTNYIRRKHLGKWRKGSKVWEQITKDTYGVIVYQEQVMEVLRRLGGMSYSRADKIRKIIAKKTPDVIDKHKRSFLKGCKKKGIVDEKEAKKIWKGLEHHAKYSFNKSHSVEYAMLCMWTAYCKYYYPAEFICASLSFMGDNKPEQKDAFLEEATRLGLKLVLPKIGKSDGFRWVAKANKLYVPFIEVKGLGTKTVDKLMVQRRTKKKKKVKGFFDYDENKLEHEPRTKVEKILTAIGAFNLKENVPGGVQEYFDFALQGDFGKTHPKLCQLYGGDLTSVDLKDAEQGKIYKKGIVRKKSYKGRAVLTCKACELRQECDKPVPNSKGKYNIAIILEAPGFEENKKGKPAIGSAGNRLWKELRQYNLTREMFHVTNVNKCWPSKSRTPNKEQIVACCHWVNQELKAINCRIALVCGANAMFYFTGTKAGITKLSGTVVWNEQRSMWGVLCVHPSAVLRNRKRNEEPFERGIQSFAEVVERFIRYEK